MPTALITVSGTHISFRLRAISPRQFHLHLSRLKNQLPLMYWSLVERVWQLPVDELKTVYEACRALFGPAQVHLAMNYKPSERAVQHRLFD